MDKKFIQSRQRQVCYKILISLLLIVPYEWIGISLDQEHNKVNY
jgi:hypothetical protein